MSTRDDARLTARERAALSNLEAQAAAADPQLAVRLRGPRRWRLLDSGHLVSRLSRLVSSKLGHSLPLGVSGVAVGLALVVVSLSVGWPLGVLGALLSAGGLASVGSYAKGRLSGGRDGRPGHLPD